MSVFQILNQYVTIIDGDKTYSDTVEHFKADAGVAVTSPSVIYDSKQKCCVVGNEWLVYPNDTYENYIKKLDNLIAAKEKREYVAPADPTIEEQKAQLKADYDAEASAMRDEFAIALLRDDADAQASIRADFADLQEAYKSEVEELES